MNERTSADMTLRELFGGSKVSHLWSLLGAITTLLGGAFTLGVWTHNLNSNPPNNGTTNDPLQDVTSSHGYAGLWSCTVMNQDPELHWEGAGDLRVFIFYNRQSDTYEGFSKYVPDPRPTRNPLWVRHLSISRFSPKDLSMDVQLIGEPTNYAPRVMVKILSDGQQFEGTTHIPNWNCKFTFSKGRP